MLTITPTIESRFWTKVHKTDSCWLWTDCPTTQGYGKMWWATGPKVRDAMSAHRLSWIIHFGDIPTGLCVLHKCDVRACVRPDHLFLGTLDDNAHDAFSKGRRTGRPGEKSPNAKLTDDLVRLVKSAYADGREYEDMAAELGMNPSSVSEAGNGTRWRHLNVASDQARHAYVVGVKT